MKLLLIFVCFLLIDALSSTTRAQAPSATIPNFTFYRLDGAPFRKANLPPTNKIIIIFFEVDCKHCQRETEDIEKNFDEFKTVSLYMVALNPPSDIEKFIEKYGKRIKDKKNLTLLHDKDKQFINKFSPTKYPSLYVYSAQGNLIQYFGGFTKIKELVKAIK